VAGIAVASAASAENAGYAAASAVVAGIADATHLYL